MLMKTGSEFFLLLSWLSLIVVTFVVCLLLLKTLRAITSGALFQPD
jgi:tellurite resistance protein